MDERTFRAALVGNFDFPEMVPVREAVLRQLSGWEVREFPGLGELTEAAQSAGDYPDLISVSQRLRDEYSADEVRQGLGTFPVTRWICVYGAWCESEGRHGSRWPMAVRVPVRSLETRLAIEAWVVRGQTPALPLTAARDEVFEFDTDRRFPHAPREGLTIGVFSPDKAYREWLSDLCRQAGYGVVSPKENMPKDVLIVDLDPFTDSTRERLERLKQANPKAWILGLKGMVLPEDQGMLPQRGANDAPLETRTRRRNLKISNRTGDQLFLRRLAKPVTGLGPSE